MRQDTPTRRHLRRAAPFTAPTLELLIQLLEYWQRDTSAAVPVPISAASYDTRLAWEQWLARDLALRYAVDTPVVESLIRGGRILPIIDGLYEMDPPGAPERAQTLVKALNTWVRGWERDRDVLG